MRRYAIKLDKYNIDKNRYYELAAFCRQYEAKKRSSEDAQRRDAQLIEDAARETDAPNQNAILQNVTAGIPYEQLQTYCGRRQFYEMRRKFFWILNQRKIG